MRPTARLFATIVKGNTKRLESNTPTGLTGVLTHPSPRPHLIYLYNATLSKLSRFPEDSVYRKSTEALTKQRLAIVESALPDGLSEWQQRISQLAAQPEATPERSLARLMVQGKGYLPQVQDIRDSRYIEWDDDQGAERPEGPREAEHLAHNQAEEFGDGKEVHEIAPRHVYVEDEPGLSADQISDIEHKIGAGLIEEVVKVAQGELNLVDEMRNNQVWEEMTAEDKPPQGMWQYFERHPNVGATESA